MSLNFVSIVKNSHFSSKKNLSDLKIDDTNTETQVIQTSGTSIDLRRLMHKCDDCGRIFPRLSELKEHRATHSDERPFECWLCHRQ